MVSTYRQSYRTTIFKIHRPDDPGSTDNLIAGFAGMKRARHPSRLSLRIVFDACRRRGSI